MTGIKEQMDKAFGIRSDNALTLSVEDELKNIDIKRELRDLGKDYREGHINDKIAKGNIEMMIMGANREQLEGVWLKIIWDNQTKDEKERGVTGHRNKIGLNRVDAPFVSSLMKQIKTGHSLTVKQVETIKKVLCKYWKQYLD